MGDCHFALLPLEASPVEWEIYLKDQARPGSLYMSIHPLCCLIMPHIERPSPDPLPAPLVVKNVSNILPLVFTGPRIVEVFIMPIKPGMMNGLDVKRYTSGSGKTTGLYGTLSKSLRR